VVAATKARETVAEPFCVTLWTPPHSAFLHEYFLRRLVGDGQLGSLHSRQPLLRFEQQGKSARGKQGALDRICRFAGYEHVLDALHQPVEMRQRTAALFKAKEAGIDLRRIPAPGGKRPWAAAWRQNQRYGGHPVPVLQSKQHRAAGLFFNSHGLAKWIAAHGFIDQRPRPAAFARKPAPDRIALHPFHPLDARFPSLSPFHHALERLEQVKSISIERPVAHGNGLRQRRFERILERRIANGDRYRRSRHPRDPQAGRAIIERFRFFPRIGKMLVEECGNGASAGLEHVENLVEQFEAGIELLAQLVVGIIAVLAYEHNRVHGQIRAAHRQRFADGRIDAEPVARRQVAAHIVLRNLLRVERNQAGPRRRMHVVG